MEEERAKEAEGRLEAEERARIASRPRNHDLDISILGADEDTQEMTALSTTLQNVAEAPWPRRVGDPEAFVFENDKKDETALSDLRERLQSLKIVSRAKVTQDRVYSAAYHPEVTKDLIFFGGTLNTLLLYLRYSRVQTNMDSLVYGTQEHQPKR